MDQHKAGKRFELHYYHIVGLLSVAAALWTFCLVRSQPTDVNLLRTLLALWAVIPPVIFFIEYHIVRSQPNADLEGLKASQELAGRIWAGVYAALAVLYLKC
jgi:hypothetical protein